MNMLKQFIKQWYWWVNTVLYKSMGKVSLRMFDWWLTTQCFSHIWLWICLNWSNLLLSLLPYLLVITLIKTLGPTCGERTADYSGVNLKCLKGFVHLFFICLLIIVCFCLFSNCLLDFAFLYWFFILYLLFFVRIKAYNLPIFSKTYLCWSSIKFPSFMWSNR